MGQILDKGQGFLGRFSELIFANPASSISDTQLDYIIGKLTDDSILKNIFKHYISYIEPSSFSTSHLPSYSFAGALILVEDEELTSELINASNTRTGNMLMVTSDQNCDVVQRGIFSYHLRLDSLCYALCSSSGGVRRVIELYKVF